MEEHESSNPYVPITRYHFVNPLSQLNSSHLSYPPTLLPSTHPHPLPHHPSPLQPSTINHQQPKPLQPSTSQTIKPPSSPHHSPPTPSKQQQQCHPKSPPKSKSLTTPRPINPNPTTNAAAIIPSSVTETKMNRK